MIRTWASRYEITPLTTIGAIADLEPRQGAIIKVQWSNGKTGYADLHPWPELGDFDLDVQLDAVSRGKLTCPAEQTIWMAKRDAILRSEKKSAFSGLSKVKNHFLITDFTKVGEAVLREIKESGFTTVKIKVGRSTEDEVKFINKVVRQSPLQIRLDFNSKSTYDKFAKFISLLSAGEKKRIEYVEDPFPWDEQGWTEAAKLAPLAVDAEATNIDWKKIKLPPFKVMVIKPARQDLDQAVERVNKFALKMVITSALDHPVGIAHASYVAGELKKIYPNVLLDCGCLTVRSYKPNEFSTKMMIQGPYLNNVPGTGVGFDDLFAKLEWQPLHV